MVPPKLTVVPHRAEPGEARYADDSEPAVDASEVLAHEGWRGLPPNVGRLPSADRRQEELRPLPRRRVAHRDLFADNDG